MIRRCLKAIALVLILLPEPITTALGLALLSIIMVLSRHKRLSDLGDMEELIKRSMKTTRSNESGLRSIRGQTVVFHQLKMSPDQQTAIVSGKVNDLKISQPTYQGNSWFDNRKVSEKVLHHTLRTSFPQYEAESSHISTGDYKATSKGRVQTIKLHTLAKILS